MNGDENIHKQVAMPSADWPENRKHVLAELERLSRAQAGHETTASERHVELLKEIGGVKVEVAGLKGKASVWGGIAAAIVATLIEIALHAMNK